MSEEKSRTRLEMSDSIVDIITKMSDGNAGAMRVCMELLDAGQKIDPDAALGGLAPLLSLDLHGIYGPHIWMLYKDVCEEDLPKMVAVLRACQLGFVSSKAVEHAIDNYGDGIDVIDLVRQVRDSLPNFMTEGEVEG